MPYHASGDLRRVARVVFAGDLTLGCNNLAVPRPWSILFRVQGLALGFTVEGLGLGAMGFASFFFFASSARKAGGNPRILHSLLLHGFVFSIPKPCTKLKPQTCKPILYLMNLPPFPRSDFLEKTVEDFGLRVVALLPADPHVSYCPHWALNFRIISCIGLFGSLSGFRVCRFSCCAIP